MLLKVLGVLALLAGIALLITRSLVVARLQERGGIPGVGRYSSFNFSDNLAWKVIRVERALTSARERVLFRSFFAVWLLLHVLGVLIIVTLAAGN